MSHIEQIQQIDRILEALDQHDIELVLSYIGSTTWIVDNGIEQKAKKYLETLVQLKKLCPII